MEDFIQSSDNESDDIMWQPANQDNDKIQMDTKTRF